MTPHPLWLLPLGLCLACPADETATGPGTTGDGATTGHSATSATPTTRPDPSATATGPGTSEPPVTTTDADATTGEPATGTTGAPRGDCEAIELADPNLLANIRGALMIPDGPISPEAALTLLKLDVNDGPDEQLVASLAGIECFTNLGNIFIQRSKLTDLAPIAALSRLETLQVRDAQVTDVTPLAGLHQLRTVTLWNNPVQDFGPIAGHPSIEFFGADGTQPLDLLAFASMPELDYLSLRGCGLEDVETLAGAQLSALDLNDNQLTDLTGLEGAPNLRILFAESNQLTSLAALAGSAALEELTVQDNQLTSLQPLAGALALRVLHAGRNPLVDLTGLVDLPALFHVTVIEAGLGALLPIAPKTLVLLDASDNKITSVAPLAGHQVLSNVNLTENKITSLAPIADAPWIHTDCPTLHVQSNPLDADTLDVVLPALCEPSTALISWDQGFCEPDGMLCGFSDP